MAATINNGRGRTKVLSAAAETGLEIEKRRVDPVILIGYRDEFECSQLFCESSFGGIHDALPSELSDAERQAESPDVRVVPGDWRCIRR